MNEFKAGDLVYSPTEGTQVFKVTDYHKSSVFTIAVGGRAFTSHGMYSGLDKYPSIFHATKENQALLEALYGIKFDDPPLSDKEKVIEALKNSNGKPLLCWVKMNAGGWFIRAIDSHLHGIFYSTDHPLCYTDAKPLSPDEFVLA